MTHLPENAASLFNLSNVPWWTLALLPPLALSSATVTLSVLAARGLSGPMAIFGYSAGIAVFLGFLALVSPATMEIKAELSLPALTFVVGVLVVIGIFMGGPANLALGHALVRAPEPGYVWAIQTLTAPMTLLFFYAVAYFRKLPIEQYPEITWVHLMGVLLFIAGACTFAFADRIVQFTAKL